MATTAEAIYNSTVDGAQFLVRKRSDEVPSTDISGDSANTKWRARLATTVSTESMNAVDSHPFRIRQLAGRPKIDEAQVQRKKYIDGSINGPANVDGLVPCGVRVSGGYVEITLPVSAFDMPIVYGSPFRFSMEIVDGYSSPRAVPIDPSPLSDADRELYDSIFS